MNAFAYALVFVGLPIGLGFTLPKLFILTLCVWRQGWEGFEVPPRMALPLAVTTVIILLSSFYSINRGMSFLGRLDSWAYGALACGLYMAVYLMSYKNPPSRKALAWLGVLISVHCLIQKVGLDPIIPKNMIGGNRSVSYVGSPVDVGAILCMLFFMAEESWWQALVILAGVWAAGSRAGALAIGFGSLAWLFPKRARLIACVSFLFFLIPARQAKDIARREVWLGAVDVFKAHPVLGSGPDTFIQVFDGKHLEMMRATLSPMSTQAQAHNDILQALATTGVLGLLCYLWLLWELPACPALVALFVFMKFDPVALEVLAIAAMVVGMEHRKVDEFGWWNEFCRKMDRGEKL